MYFQELRILELRLLEFLSLPIIGRIIQKKSVTTLAKIPSVNSVKALAKVVTRHKDNELQSIALEALDKIENQDSIDAVCQIWQDSRDLDLSKLLIKKSWVASVPISTRVLTALKTEQLQIIFHGGKEIVEPLLNAFQDQEFEIALNARTCAESLINSDSIDTICQMWVNTRETYLEQVITQGKYIARSPIKVRVLTALKIANFKAIKDGGREIVTPFLNALLHDKDPEIVKNARKCGLLLTNYDAIDVICQNWVATRNITLEQVITQGKYIARSPSEVRVLTALKIANFKAIIDNQIKSIEHLIKAFEDKNPEISRNAKECAKFLTEPKCLYLICQAWANSRANYLEDLIRKKNYFPQQPIEVKALTALKLGNFEVVKNGETNIIDPLLRAIRDNDVEIAQNARQCALSLTKIGNIEYVCSLAVGRHRIARQIAIEAQYAPQDLSQRALFYFLTEQWEKYETLDYDYSLLEKVYEYGDLSLRKQIADKARQEGHILWIEIFAVEGKNRRLSKMTVIEWETTISILSRNKKWEEMWQLAQVAPAKWSQRLFRKFMHSSWTPEAEDERVAFLKFKYLANRCPLEILITDKPKTNQKTLANHQGSVNGISFSPDNQYLASCSSDGTIKLWQVPEGDLIITLAKHQGSVNGISFSPDNQYLASCSSDGTIKLWQVPEGDLIITLAKHQGSVNGISFSPDNQYLASCSSDGTIKLWQVPEGDLIITLAKHQGSVNGISFSPDNQYLASCSSDGTIKLWQISDGRLLDTKHARKINKVISFSPSEKILASCNNKTIRLWQISNGKLISIATFVEYTTSLIGIQFSPDGQFLVGHGDNGVIKLWSSNLFQIPEQPIKDLDEQHKNFVRKTLSQLLDQPIKDLDEQHKNFVRKTLSQHKTSQEEKLWLEFMQALINWHRRFDIELETSTPLNYGNEFDIEIEE